MKIKLTPLNIVSSICLVFAGWLILTREPAKYRMHVDITNMLVVLSTLTAVIAFVSDLIFRKFIPSLKKLWIIEGVLVIFIIILIFIINSSIS